MNSFVAFLVIELARGYGKARATLVVNNLHRERPEIMALCHGLEKAFGTFASANGYLTPAGATGFSPHDDDHAVFVLQVGLIVIVHLEACLAKHWLNVITSQPPLKSLA